MKRLYVPFAVLATFGAAVSSGIAQDRVFNAKNVPTPGTVTEMSPEKVVIDTPGGARTFEVNEITRISFSEDPPVLHKSRDLIKEGQLESALADLKTLDPNSVQRDVVKQDLLYLRAYCEAKIALASGGKREDALQLLFEFIKANQGSYHFYEGVELLGELSTVLGQHDRAASYYGQLAKAPWPDYRLRASVLQGRSLAAQKKNAEALEKFESVISSAEGNPEATRQKLLATVGKAATMVSNNQADDAIKLLEDLIKNNDTKDTRLFGRAYTALGSAYLSAGRQKDALLAFLHVDLLFYQESDTHAEALYNLTKIWGEMQKADRAVECRAKLQEHYGGSAWAKASGG